MKSLTGYRKVQQCSTVGYTLPDTMQMVKPAYCIYLLSILRGPIVEQFLSVCALFRDVEYVDVVFGQGHLLEAVCRTSSVDVGEQETHRRVERVFLVT